MSVGSGIRKRARTKVEYQPLVDQIYENWARQLEQDLQTLVDADHGAPTEEKPKLSLAAKFAVIGATKKSSAPRTTSIWSIPPWRSSLNSSTKGASEVIASKSCGETSSAALSVMTVLTVCPACTSLLARSQAL